MNYYSHIYITTNRIGNGQNETVKSQQNQTLGLFLLSIFFTYQTVLQKLSSQSNLLLNQFLTFYTLKATIQEMEKKTGTSLTTKQLTP